MANECWYRRAGPENGLVLATQVRLVRDLEGVPFPHRAGPEEKKEVMTQVREALLTRGGLVSTVQELLLEELSVRELVSLAERGVLSPETISDPRGKGLFLALDESFSVLVNDRDHLEIRTAAPGLAPEEAVQAAQRLETLLGETMKLAFDPELGYLTQDPSDLGTGLRVSLRLHLPALAEAGAMDRLAANLGKLGLFLRSPLGQADPSGQYLLTNRLTLGLTEEEAAGNLAAIARQLIQQERQARGDTEGSLALRDKIDRAVGVLKSARLLSAEETGSLLSLLRLGVSLGLVPGVSPETVLALDLETQTATLMTQAGKALTPQECDSLRAQVIRDALTSAGP